MRGEFRAASPTLRHRVGSVPQKDLLHPQLRLGRSLEYAAWSRGATSSDTPAQPSDWLTKPVSISAVRHLLRSAPQPERRDAPPPSTPPGSPRDCGSPRRRRHRPTLPTGRRNARPAPRPCQDMASGLAGSMAARRAPGASAPYITWVQPLQAQPNLTASAAARVDLPAPPGPSIARFTMPPSSLMSSLRANHPSGPAQRGTVDDTEILTPMVTPAAMRLARLIVRNELPQVSGNNSSLPRSRGFQMSVTQRVRKDASRINPTDSPSCCCTRFPILSHSQ